MSRTLVCVGAASRTVVQPAAVCQARCALWRLDAGLRAPLGARGLLSLLSWTALACGGEAAFAGAAREQGGTARAAAGCTALVRSYACRTRLTCMLWVREAASACGGKRDVCSTICRLLLGPHLLRRGAPRSCWCTLPVMCPAGPSVANLKQFCGPAAAAGGPLLATASAGGCASGPSAAPFTEPASRRLAGRWST